MSTNISVSLHSALIVSDNIRIQGYLIEQTEESSDKDNIILHSTNDDEFELFENQLIEIDSTGAAYAVTIEGKRVYLEFEAVSPLDPTQIKAL